ncbi:hypothetical protein T492DRAFT_886051, partial [Pavlovales sp. CCMP2436]
MMGSGRHWGDVFEFTPGLGCTAGRRPQRGRLVSPPLSPRPSRHDGMFPSPRFAGRPAAASSPDDERGAQVPVDSPDHISPWGRQVAQMSAGLAPPRERMQMAGTQLAVGNASFVSPQERSEPPTGAYGNLHLGPVYTLVAGINPQVTLLLRSATFFISPRARHGFFYGAAFAMGGVPLGDVDMPNLLSFIPPAPQLRPPLLEAINESFGKVFLLVQKAGPDSIKNDITLARKLDAELLSRYRKASTGLHPDKFNSIPNITIYDATIKGQPANDIQDAMPNPRSTDWSNNFHFH